LAKSAKELQQKKQEKGNDVSKTCQKVEHKSENPIRPLEGWWAASLFFFFLFWVRTFAIGIATILKLFGCKFSDFWGKEIAKIRERIYIYIFWPDFYSWFK
jgi:hypothetical protein